MSSIFLSHSSKDNPIAKEVKARLEQWGHRSVFLDFDPEDGIPAGRDWEKELYAKLRECRAVIVLCSHASMASKWCFAEIAHAKALGKEFFPIKIDDSKIDPILTGNQVIDVTSNWDEGFHRLAKGLLKAGLDPKDLFDWDGTRPPYPGLPAFQEQDAAIFFGRDDEIREGQALLNRLQQFGGPRLTLMLGASGSGKSSLMRAGLVPKLKRVQRWVVIDPFRPLRAPFDELATVLSQRFSQNKQAGMAIPTDVAQVRDRIRWNEQDPKQSVDMFLQLLKELCDKFGSREEATVLLLLDQCEELLTVGINEEGNRFLAFLRAVLDREDSSLMVLATLRSDFLGSFQDHPTMRGLRVETFPVPQMEVDDFTSVIEGPARIAGLELGSGLVTAMIGDTKTSDALPLLAFTLRELYEGFGQDKLLTLEEYRDKLGRLDGCIARAAESVLSAKSLSEKEISDLRTAFLSMVRVNDQDQYAKQPVQWNDLPVAIHEVLERFVSARLLLSGGTEKRRTLEVVHEALFRAWPRLAEWLKDNKAFLVWQNRLRGAIKQYKEGKVKTDFLLRGFPLTEAMEWLRKKPDHFSPAERQFVTASQNRRTRDRIITSVITVCLLMLIGGPTAWLWNEGITVQYATSIALGRFHIVSVTVPEMVTIPSGTYLQGNQGPFNTEKPVREVTIKTFAIGKYEVTFEEYDHYVDLTGARRPADHDWGRGKHPVIYVSWEDAMAYAKWLSQATGKRYRLPTESEWEYAARSGGRDEMFAGTSDLSQIADYAVYDKEQTELVGSKKPNGLGLYDMSGNVEELVEDCWHDSYSGAPTDGSAWLATNGGPCDDSPTSLRGDARVLRGGSAGTLLGGLRATMRFRLSAEERRKFLGFRLAQDVEP